MTVAPSSGVVGLHVIGRNMADKYDTELYKTPLYCAWASRREQANNRRSNRVITLGGSTKTLEQWIRDRGLKSSTVRQRIYAYGWPVERALGDIT